MAQVMQIKRRLGSVGQPASGTGPTEVRAGELATSIGTVGATGITNLYVGDGSFVHPLVSAARQVELAGAQTITGAKTIGPTGSLTMPISSLHVTGGATGQTLVTSNITTGVLEWEDFPENSSFGATGHSPARLGDIWWSSSGPQYWNGTTWVTATLPGFSGVATQAPITGDGTTGAPLGATGLVELAGAQTIGGHKTIGPTGGLTVPIGVLHVGGGTTGQTIVTDGAGNLSWGLGFDGVSTSAPLFGTGLTGAPIGVSGATGGLIEGGTDTTYPITSEGLRSVIGDDVANLDTTNKNVVDAINELHGRVVAGVTTQAPVFGAGTTGAPIGVSGATGGQIVTGSDAVYPITSAGLHTYVLGLAPTSLTTDAKTVVPAINELVTAIGAVSGAIRFAGTYNAATHLVAGAPAGTLTNGAALPAAGATGAPPANNEGFYLIVSPGGTGAAPAPVVPMEANDWLVSNGDAWIHIPLYHAAVAASAVSVNNAAGSVLEDETSWTNVQLALEGIYTMVTTAGNIPVLVDGVSIIGDGTSSGATGAGPLTAALLDGGTF